METLILLLVILVSLSLIATARAARSRKHLGKPPPGPPTFRVVAIGLQGSGKTMLLSSMYHQLQTPVSQSYFLTAPYDQVIALSRTYNQIADTGESWPPGTTKGEIREYDFSVETQAGGASYPIAKLNYLEYAGELLTERQPPGSTLLPTLLAHITSAHALIGIIDGHRVLQCLQGDSAGQRHLQHAFTAMINLMMRPSSPVAFVITKWDLLQGLHPDESTRLRIVSDLLMANPLFCHLVRRHGAERVVRLIPVSAVGREFAALDENGRIVKRREGHLHPVNVDVPLSAVIPDLFEQVEHRLDAATLEAAVQQARRQAGLGPLAWAASMGQFVGQASGRAIVAAFGSPVAQAFGGPVVELFLASRGDSPAEEFEALLDGETARFHHFCAARKRVLRDLQSKVDVLEGRLPHSRLSSR
jgi:GTPase SAR1 family protein